MPKSKLEKQKQAEERSKGRAKISHKDQMSHLDAKFGKDQGAAKERTRLSSLIQSAVTASSEKPKKKKKKSEEE